MLADPLTKAMDCKRLESALANGRMDLSPTAESLMIKERNRAYRKDVKEQIQANKDSNKEDEDPEM